MATTVSNKLTPVQKASKFLRETWLELKKTSWPSKEELQKSTILVLAAVAIITLWIGGLDYIFGVTTRRFVGW